MMSTIVKKAAIRHGTDKVLQEIWRVKDELSSARGHSLIKLFADAREHQKFSGHRIVNLSKSKASRRKATNDKI